MAVAFASRYPKASALGLITQPMKRALAPGVCFLVTFANLSLQIKPENKNDGEQTTLENSRQAPISDFSDGKNYWGIRVFHWKVI
jgi:hypothetical protein